jgi:hypothetical protein
MFTVIEIPEFSLSALLRFQPMLRREPVGVLAGEGRRAVVLYVSPSARGVSPGMTAAQALAECPALQLVSPSLSAEREAGALLLAAAWTLYLVGHLHGRSLRSFAGRIAEAIAGVARTVGRGGFAG